MNRRRGIHYEADPVPDHEGQAKDEEKEPCPIDNLRAILHGSALVGIERLPLMGDQPSALAAHALEEIDVPLGTIEIIVLGIDAATGRLEQNLEDLHTLSFLMGWQQMMSQILESCLQENL